MIRKFTINGTEVEISFNAKTHRYTITINGVKNHSPSVSTILKLGDTFGIASANLQDNFDYICGIQIPYNSMIKSSDGEQYVARNFFMPTGWYDKNEKDSSNAMAAGTQFSGVDNFTGISGGMKSMEITYDAGEAVYNFDMQFLPSDVMI